MIGVCCGQIVLQNRSDLTYLGRHFASKAIDELVNELAGNLVSGCSLDHYMMKFQFVALFIQEKFVSTRSTASVLRDDPKVRPESL